MVFHDVSGRGMLWNRAAGRQTGWNMSTVTLLKYSNTNTYLIEGSSGAILFDTGWAGTFNEFCKALGEAGKRLQDISYIMISHFHPDHMGIVQEIADHGATIVVPELQKPYLHTADDIFAKDKRIRFKSIEDDKVKVISLDVSRAFLKMIGLEGEILHTPGHSDDSISLWLDEGLLFVGDLNPLYELEMHKGTMIGESWEKLLRLGPKKVYYGHAKPAELSGGSLQANPEMNKAGSSLSETSSEKNGGSLSEPGSARDGGSLTETGSDISSGLALGDTANIDKENTADRDMYLLVSRIMKYIDRGYSLEKIERKTGASSEFIEDVSRMYLTHQNVGVQGILDRIEIKN